jgi:hypothetical protein
MDGPAHPWIGRPAHGYRHPRLGWPIHGWAGPPMDMRSSGVGYIERNICFSIYPQTTYIMDPIIASISPFFNDVRIAFQAYIQGIGYIN